MTDNECGVVKYADVIIPLPLANCFTYSIPDEMADCVQIGHRVIVPFGAKKFYTAVVLRIHENAPTEYVIKDLFSLLDDQPIVLESQLTFWQWIASYYLCFLGEVYKAALPAGLKLESETMLMLNEEFDQPNLLRPNEVVVLDLLAGAKEATISQLERNAKGKNLTAVLKSLLEKEAILIKEMLKRAYKPKIERYMRLQAEYRSETALSELIPKLAKSASQLAFLMHYIDRSNVLHPDKFKELKKSELASYSASISALVKKGVFEIYEKESTRLATQPIEVGELYPLHVAQQKALSEIKICFKKWPVCLLHGITSSGKTELYIHLIKETLAAGKQVLYLLPEIALTTQITDRLRRVFGVKLGVYHSKFSDNERVEIWNKQLQKSPYQLILGVRSSLFLPFQNLGLVIVDEEHETTYKQQDPAPRYHARNAAIVLASQTGANVLLGTATPSVESYFNAKEGKYGLVELFERYQEMELPQIVPIDIKELAHKKQMKGNFSPQLMAQMSEALAKQEQVILFQNRRGFAPMMECKTCGWVPKCNYCDVSLTFHKGLNQVTCHYCGYTEKLLKQCPACESMELVFKGFGTEKIEEEVQEHFPASKVVRMDLDTTRTRSAYESILSSFEQGRSSILIGTQMVSKGLDFDHVSLVGILNADGLLSYPDFRADERAFQLMAQVSGRAGRKSKRGLVILQTKSIDHPIIRQVIENDYLGMYEMQLKERELFKYPPYHRLIAVFLKHKELDVVNLAAKLMADRLRGSFGGRVLGPDNPAVGRIQSLYIKKILLKVEISASIAQAKDILIQVQQQLVGDVRFKSVIVYYDVDPY